MDKLTSARETLWHSCVAHVYEMNKLLGGGLKLTDREANMLIVKLYEQMEFLIPSVSSAEGDPHGQS